MLGKLAGGFSIEDPLVKHRAIAVEERNALQSQFPINANLGGAEFTVRTPFLSCLHRFDSRHPLQPSTAPPSRAVIGSQPPLALVEPFG